MQPEEEGPARAPTRNGASSFRPDQKHITLPPCTVAPLNPRLRVIAHADQAESFEVGWAADHRRGRTIRVHHYVNGVLAVVDIPLGGLLPLWTDEPSATRDWVPLRGRPRSSDFWFDGSGALVLKVTQPDAQIAIPIYLVEEFKFATALLLRLTDKVVGVQGNLTDRGGTFRTPPRCSACGRSAAGCRANDLGVTHCLHQEHGAVATLQDGRWLHVSGEAALRVRVAEEPGGLA